MVRAKFRCMSVARHLDANTHVRLLPVMPKSKHDPDGSDENKAFWEATPSGEIEVYYPQEQVPMTVGQCYYIDMKPLTARQPASWKLWELIQQESSLRIKMDLRWDIEQIPTRGTLEMSIDNQRAWPAFRDEVGTFWEVTFTEAP